MDDTELTEAERHALDAWTTLSPPPGFADRVLGARDVPTAPRRRRWPLIAGAVVACAAAAAVVVLVTRDGGHADHGALAASVRTTRALGDRAIAVAEPSSDLTWHVDDEGDAVVEQRAGNVFYRVDKGGAFVVKTPAGDVRVTGTCFRIEVEPMTKTKQLLVSGAVGAAIATGVLVTVYEGRVVAETGGAKTEVVAGNQATLGPDGTVVTTGSGTRQGAIAIATATPDEARATREELLARTVAQRTELAKLRARVSELEQGSGGGRHPLAAEPGRAWYDPSPERLAQFAAECRIRADEPGLDRWKPWTTVGKNDRGLEPDELPAFNAAISEVQQQWKATLRALYLEATGDTAGVDTLSPEAMRGEIQEKGSPEEHSLIIQRIANERAGLAQPPADLSKTSPYERMMRAYIALGDQTEAALAKRLGPERAKAIRGDAWSSQSDWSGCPDNGQ